MPSPISSFRSACAPWHGHTRADFLGFRRLYRTCVTLGKREGSGVVFLLARRDYPESLWPFAGVLLLLLLDLRGCSTGNDNVCKSRRCCDTEYAALSFPGQGGGGRHPTVESTCWLA